MWLEDAKNAGDGGNSKNKGEGIKLFWGSSWHMQTPLDNLESGSFITIEYKAPPVAGLNAQSMTGVSGTIDLNIGVIDSGHQFLILSDNNPKQSNQGFVNNDKSILSVELVINQRNRAIDYRMVYGM
jgi:hypothetical protein